MVSWPDPRRMTAWLLLALVFASPDRVAADTALAAASEVDSEHLVFKVEWHPPWYLFFLPPMEAGEVEIRVFEQVNFMDRPARMVTFDARSSGTLVKVTGVKVEDHFEYFSDPVSMCSLGARKRSAEGRRKRDIEIQYFVDQRKLHIRELDTGTNPPKLKKDRTVEGLPACVQDIFTALATVRKKEFFQGARYSVVVGDNDTVKEVQVRVDKAEKIETPAGNFPAWRVTTLAVMGGLFKEGGQFRIWLADEGPRLPVWFEAKVSLGTVTGILKSKSP